MVKRIKENKMLQEAESYGWVVESYEAYEAYDMACDYFGKEYVNDQIVDTLSDDELASSLAYLFRMWDFRQWDERGTGAKDSLEDEEFDESVKRNKRRMKEARIGRTKEVKVLQGNWGSGWDDLCEYDKYDNGECKADLKAYMENDPTARYRVIFRRVPNKDYVEK